jgi:hypothetical protein
VPHKDTSRLKLELTAALYFAPRTAVGTRRPNATGAPTCVSASVASGLRFAEPAMPRTCDRHAQRLGSIAKRFVRSPATASAAPY